MKYNLVILIAFAATCIQCSERDEVVIDEVLQPYYDAFLMEADLRGLKFTSAELNVSAILDDLNGLAGQCQHFSDRPDVAVVDNTLWHNADSNKKEFLLFHELGHCILGRSHTDEKDENGKCLSIMHSSNTICTIEYNEETRKAYLDELFNL